MIPSIKAYLNSTVKRAKSQFQVEDMLEQFGIKNTIWRRNDPKDTWLAFEFQKEDGQKLVFKINVPFVEKEAADPDNRGEKVIVYDEIRSFRFFYHIFKAQLQNTELGMEFDQMFLQYLVVDRMKDGTLITAHDQILQKIADKKIPALEGF